MESTLIFHDLRKTLAPQSKRLMVMCVGVCACVCVCVCFVCDEGNVSAVHQCMAELL